ncbi:YkgJ family cysteine cluster protein [Parafilimonas sp.]|uniref:YkgJ family cysteine cluster protein n=1 Tax=Parafilimonas sp. TaxID=1969739 RepID=UPI0039E65DAD
MQPVNFHSFRKKVGLYKKQFKRYLRQVQKIKPQGLDDLAEQINTEVWQEIDCLSCANCCKKMTPTFTAEDIRRIAKHLHIRPRDFKERWLKYDKKDDDWVNVNQPCQFLDLATNMCSIYEVRPADCAGFPHLAKKKMVDYMHVHEQNIEYCPATFKMVEKMMEKIKIG